MLYIPETQGVSLEAMDIIFGATTAEQREADIQRRAKGLHIEKDVADIDHHEDVKRSSDMV